MTQGAAPKQVSLEDRIDQYVKLRDIIKEKDDAHKQAMAPYRDTLGSLEAVILDLLRNAGGDSIKTKAGTAYKSIKRTASLEDADRFMDFVIAKQAFHLLDRKVNVTAAEDWIKENQVPPPGVKFTSVETVNIRRPTGK